MSRRRSSMFGGCLNIILTIALFPILVIFHLVKNVNKDRKY